MFCKQCYRNGSQAKCIVWLVKLTTETAIDCMCFTMSISQESWDYTMNIICTEQHLSGPFPNVNACTVVSHQEPPACAKLKTRIFSTVQINLIMSETVTQLYAFLG